MNKARVISLSNMKGGVSKTSSSISIGCILAKKGYKVLLVDLDAQANLTNSLLSGEFQETVFTAMLGKSALPIIPVRDNLSVVPASLQMATADLELSGAMARERLLKDLLDPIREKFHFIILDCPPSLGLITLNAFTASTDIIVPIVAEVLPFMGLKMIYNFLNMVNRRLNPEVHILGILLCRWEEVNLSKRIEAKMREQLGSLVFQTKIRKNITIAAAPLEKQDILTFNPKSNGAKDYLDFTEELLRKLK